MAAAALFGVQVRPRSLLEEPEKVSLASANGPVPALQMHVADAAR